MAALLPALAVLFWTLLSAGRPALAAPAETPTLSQNAASVDQPGLVMTLTVSASADSCGTADHMTVARGMRVYLCYTVTNTGNVTFTHHLIADSSVTQIYKQFEPGSQDLTLAPQQTINTVDRGIILSFDPSETTTRSDVWIANSGPGSAQVQAGDSVTIDVIVPKIEVVQTVGTDAASCSDLRSITVPSGTTAHFCLTLTNRGNAPLLTHAISLPALAITGTVSVPMAPGETLRLTAQGATAYGLPALSIVASSAISSEARIESRTAEGYRNLALSAASVNIGTGATSIAGFVHTSDNCRDVATTSLTLVKGSAFFYCLRVTNNGNVRLDQHKLSITSPAHSVSFTYGISPGATLVITNGILTALGFDPFFGPHWVTTTVNNTFVMTSTNSSGFRSVQSAPVSITATDPTPTFTPTWTPIPPTATWTPWPTLTPWPTPTPWPTIPTATPWPTPEPPTATWTPSYALSNLATPTPNAAQAAALGVPPPQPGDPFLTQQDANAFPPQAVDEFGSPLPTPYLDPALQPPSPLASPPEMLALAEPALAQQPIELPPTDIPTATPSETPTETPSRTPHPTETPTPTVTPTATQRPVVLPTAAPPPDMIGLFTTVLDSAVSAAGLLFVMVGAIVFFGIAGAVAGMGFLRAGRRRYHLFELEPNLESDAAETGPAPGAPAATPPSPKGGQPDHWPASLP